MLYRSLLRPLLFRLAPETAHELALKTLSFSPALIEKFLSQQSLQKPFGELKRFGLTFPNPVGLAAGFDKDGVALKSLAALGFGFIEAGTVTYEAQPGNPRPRLFRLPKDKALINRAGFNNKGAAAFVEQVVADRPPCVLGVSIGKSKKVPIANAVEDYLRSFEIVHPVADYIAVNVSSPNTPGLRDLQKSDQLEELLQALQKRNRELKSQTPNGNETPLLVKLAPELERNELHHLIEVFTRTNVAGIIAANTTTRREGLLTAQEEVAACGEGGLSGKPLREQSTSMIGRIYNLTSGRIPIVGVGGIFTAEDAWEKICAGASLVQLYTGFIYEGPRIAQQINKGLEQILLREGFARLDDAVGSRARNFDED